MNTGWIKFYRQFRQWGWYDCSPVKDLFIELLLTANHEPKVYRGRLIQRGQAVFTHREIVKITRIPPQVMRSSLNKLISTHEITLETTRHFSIATIVKYDEYQQNNEQTNTQINTQINTEVTQNQHGSNTEVTHPFKKELNNGRIKELKKERESAREVLQKELKKVWDENLAKYIDLYPKVDHDLAIETILNWVSENYSKAKKRSNWDLFIRNWLNKEKPMQQKKTGQSNHHFVNETPFEEQKIEPLSPEQREMVERERMELMQRRMGK